MDIEDKVRRCVAEIDRKKFMQEDYTKDLNNLNLLIKGLKKEQKGMFAQLRWEADICASAEQRTNNKYEKYLASKPAVVIHARN